MNAHIRIPEAGPAGPAGPDLIDQAAAIAAAYVAHNAIPPSELPALIGTLHGALTGLDAVAPAEPVVHPQPSASEIRRSIRPDGLVSFIDGKSYKTLKRHLTKHGLDPHSYRERYGLPADYPTTAANYSAQRSELARGLDLSGRAAAARAAQADAA